ncbi:hypothetical protein MMC19_004759 [Ptychographa xylographoides]|nr:hypothetical protein [Ptychographa xylographoides]
MCRFVFTHYENCPDCSPKRRVSICHAGSECDNTYRYEDETIPGHCELHNEFYVFLEFAFRKAGLTSAENPGMLPSNTFRPDALAEVIGERAKADPAKVPHGPPSGEILSSKAYGDEGTEPKAPPAGVTKIEPQASPSEADSWEGYFLDGALLVAFHSHRERSHQVLGEPKPGLDGPAAALAGEAEPKDTSPPAVSHPQAPSDELANGQGSDEDMSGVQYDTGQSSPEWVV